MSKYHIGSTLLVAVAWYLSKVIPDFARHHNPDTCCGMRAAPLNQHRAAPCRATPRGPRCSSAHSRWAVIFCAFFVFLMSVVGQSHAVSNAHRLHNPQQTHRQAID